jgi:hypothetical protein
LGRFRRTEEARNWQFWTLIFLSWMDNQCDVYLWRNKGERKISRELDESNVVYLRTIECRRFRPFALSERLLYSYIVLCCKLAEFFNCNILHFKFIPWTLLGVPRNHKLHVILYRETKYSQRKGKWSGQLESIIKWQQRMIHYSRPKYESRKTYKNNVFHVVHVDCIFHGIENFVDVGSSVKLHEE